MKRVWLLISLSTLVGTASARPSESRFYQQERIARVALEQAHRVTGEWDPAQRDCAGLIRFAYRRGLGLPSTLWRNQHQEWVDYVGASELISHNFDFITRSPEPDQIESGDVLVFYNPHKKPFEAWHLMLLIKAPGSASQQTLVVYHNGESGRRAAVRKVRWENLLAEPSSWQPRSSNPLFQGVFRWQGWSRLLTKNIDITENRNRE
jgi:uncharacterized protein YfaT (DUF1175 family)